VSSIAGAVGRGWLIQPGGDTCGSNTQGIR
jgi:hypothetical protein